MARKNDLVSIKVPEEFKLAIDKRRLEEGYNNRERAKFLREICKKDDPLEKLVKGTKNQNTKRGGLDFGF